MKLLKTKLAEQGIIRGPYIWRKGAIKGQVLFWAYEVLGFKRRSLSGVLGGKTEFSEWTNCVGKNAGKTNATTDEEQALTEAKAHMEIKLKRGGYYLRREDIHKEPKFFSPMLAHKYRYGKEIVYKGELPFPVWYQPKLNGMRCTITKDHMISRYGEEVVAAPHIREALASFFDVQPDIVLDGELYNHGLGERLNKLLSLVRKKTPTEEELAESRELVQFHVYDADVGDTSDFSARYRYVEGWIRKLAADGGFIQLVPTAAVENTDVLDEMFKEFLEEGYEGGMVRLNGYPYEHKRSKSLLKDKPRQDAEFKILRIEDGKGKRAGMAARIVCALPKGTQTKEFSANVKWDDATKREIWANREKYPGTLATVSFAYLSEFFCPQHNYVELLHLDKKRKF